MIFLSHAHADRRYVHELAFELNVRGHDVWVDETHQVLGDTLWPPIKEAIQRSHVFVLVASKASLTSAYVQKEIEFASNGLEKPKVISVLLREVAGTDLPAHLQSVVYTRSDKSATVDANRISVAVGEPAPEPSPSLWLRVEHGRLRHALAALPSAAKEPGQVMLLNANHENLVAELLEQTDPTASWLAEHHGAGDDWLAWIERLPMRARGTELLISELLGRYLGHRADQSSEGNFQRAMALAAVRHLMLCLDRALARMIYLRDPSEGNREAAVAAMEPIADPNPEGILVDLVWGSREVKARCPAYVEPIDLPLGLVPASGVMMADDLGTMVGDALAARSWPRAGETFSRTMLEAQLPSLPEVLIGPA